MKSILEATTQRTTVDIDMIVSDRKLAGEILAQLSFVVEGRHWYHERLMVSIEIPNDMLEDADVSKITEILFFTFICLGN